VWFEEAAAPVVANVVIQQGVSHAVIVVVSSFGFFLAECPIGARCGAVVISCLVAGGPAPGAQDDGRPLARELPMQNNTEGSQQRSRLYFPIRR